MQHVAEGDFAWLADFLAQMFPVLVRIRVPAKMDSVRGPLGSSVPPLLLGPLLGALEEGLQVLLTVISPPFLAVSAPVPSLC